MNLNTGDGRQELQQARLLGVSGRVEEGVAAFEKLFGGVPPDQTLAIEYWALVARLPARHKEAVAQLKKLDASSRAMPTCRRRWPNRCLLTINRRKGLPI